MIFIGLGANLDSVEYGPPEAMLAAARVVFEKK